MSPGDAPIEIVDYDPSWPARFEEERLRLAGMLPGARIEHIGSTAVPGLAAAPAIDIIALVADLDGPIPVLVERGRYELLALFDGTLARRRWLCRPSAAVRLFELVLVDSLDVLTRHLRFRDALRGDLELAAAYAALKRELLVSLGGDREGYSRGKDAFVREALGE